jgi:TonB family protein
MLRECIRGALLFGAFTASLAQAAPNVKPSKPDGVQVPPQVSGLPLLPIPGFNGIRNEPRLVVFEGPDRFVCDGGAEAKPLAPLDADPIVTNVMLAPEATDTHSDAPTFHPPPIRDPKIDYSFNISPDGQVQDLVNNRATVFEAGQPFVNAQQIEPALAVLRFTPGHAMTGCQAHLDGKVLSADAAGRHEILKAFALTPFATFAAYQTPIYRYALPPGSDCYTGEAPRPRIQYFAPVDEMKEAPGARAWAVLQYDIGSDGATRNVELAASSGRKDLDDAAREAISKSRYAPHAKRGCMTKFFDTPGAVKPPPPPPIALEKTGGCPSSPKITFNGFNTYPSEFARRRVEGYALLQFDVAPWGAIGEIKVLKAEPSDAFGNAARLMLQNGKAPSGQALQGCLLPFRFKLGDGNSPTGVQITVN